MLPKIDPKKILGKLKETQGDTGCMGGVGGIHIPTQPKNTKKQC